MMRILRALVNKARNDYKELVPVLRKDLFSNVEMKNLSNDTHKRSVPLGVVRKIVNYQPVNRNEQIGKSYFLFSLLMCGINFKDINDWAFDHSSDDKILTFSRQKVLKERGYAPMLELKLFPDITKSLMAVYWGHSDTGRINRGLELIKQKIGYSGTLTFYCARHTFASIVFNELHISEELIQICLGHRSLKGSTDFYVKPNYEKIWEIQQNLYDLLMS